MTPSDKKDITIAPEDESKPPKRQTAVAIENDRSNKESLPIITASGHGLLAEKILQMAFDQGIKVRKDPDLAELLAALDINHEIPNEAIIAVAEILIQVYKANGTLPWDYTPDYAKLETAIKKDSTKKDTQKDEESPSWV